MEGKTEKYQEPTQQQRILNYIDRFGSIDRLRACYELGIFELPARITELERKGYNFEKTRKSKKSKQGYKFSCTEYRLKNYMKLKENKEDQKGDHDEQQKIETKDFPGLVCGGSGESYPTTEAD